MSLVYKIPPLVSAIAFGYGVGMAAPEGALQSVSVSARQVAAVVGAPERGARGAPQAGPREWLASGAAKGSPQESARLARLRATARDSRGETCELNRPLESRIGQNGDSGWAEHEDELDQQGSRALSRLSMPDLKLSVTRKTLSYVKFFSRSDRGRGMFETWLKRSGRFQELIQDELRRRHLPEDLMWLAMIESGFDAKAKSPAGAVGLWQFMPQTGAVYGLRQNKHLDERRNPRLATRAAAHHLRDLYMRFEDWNLALAAYNMGYEQLLDAIDRYNTTDFAELARQNALPNETANYVPKIAAAAIVANNLEHFGFSDVKLQKPFETAELAVGPGVSLKTIAKACSVPTAAIKALNPDFLGDIVPPGKGDYLVSVPPESIAKAQTALPVLLQTEPIVTDGDVLDQVDLLGGRESTRRLREARDEDKSLLSMLPPPKKRRTLRDPLAELDGGGDDDEPMLRRSKKGERETVLFKVGQGDTLLGVARKFAMDVEDVARDNRLDPGDKLREGAMLRLRVRREVLLGLDGAKGDKVERPEKNEKNEKNEKSAEKSDRSERAEKSPPKGDRAERPSAPREPSGRGVRPKKG